MVGALTGRNAPDEEGHADLSGNATSAIATERI